MKYTIIPILFYAFFPVIGKAQKKVTLEDFTIKEIRLEEPNRVYYLLELKDVEEAITIKAFSAKPVEIIDSYFDDQYLVIVYKSVSGYHYLTGVYNNGNQWLVDYFHRSLDFSSGLYEETVDKVKFLDGETVFLTYKTEGIGRQPGSQSRILRITRDYIRTYKIDDNVHEYTMKGNNPIRPID